MTEHIPGLMGFVVRALKEDRDVTSRELYERSKSRYPDVTDMTVRQFHARYPLQAKKQLNRPIVRLFPVPKAESASADDGSGRTDAGSAPGASASTGSASTGAASTGAASAGAASGTSGDAGSPGHAASSASTPSSGKRESPDDKARRRREALRTLLFKLALDMETAPTRADLVDVIRRVDHYVDEALAITGAGPRRR